LTGVEPAQIIGALQLFLTLFGAVSRESHMQDRTPGWSNVTSAAVSASEIAAPAQPADPRAASATGLILVNSKFQSMYANDTAVQILSYPASPPPMTLWAIFAQEQIRRILKADRFSASVPAAPFISGKRRYTCRQLLLQSKDRRAMLAVLLERSSRDAFDLSELSRRFHLSRRESETVLHLTRGLSTKEVAHRMSVSPNTVKQFVRLTMSKMGVTTRVGIVSKVVGGLFAAGDSSFL